MWMCGYAYIHVCGCVDMEICVYAHIPMREYVARRRCCHFGNSIYGHIRICEYMHMCICRYQDTWWVTAKCNEVWRAAGDDMIWLYTLERFQKQNCSRTYVRYTGKRARHIPVWAYVNVWICGYVHMCICGCDPDMIWCDISSALTSLTWAGFRCGGQLSYYDECLRAPYIHDHGAGFK